MNTAQAELHSLLEIVATLKDEVTELKEHRTEQSTARQHIAPGHSPDEAWSPCDQGEFKYYASLTFLH